VGLKNDGGLKRVGKKNALIFQGILGLVWRGGQQKGPGLSLAPRAQARKARDLRKNQDETTADWCACDGLLCAAVAGA
jgi:hypothetical protein